MKKKIKKKIRGGVPTNTGEGKPFKSEGREWLPPENILSRHFEKSAWYGPKTYRTC